MMAPGEENDFLEARAGDHLFCPFECDYCSFYRLRSAVPDMTLPEDARLMIYIRRALLDAFWSRRPGTVHGLVNLFREQVEVGEDFGFNMFHPLGPFNFNYDSGMGAAIGILWRSRKAGLHEPTMKFSSVRKARSLHTDIYNASASHADRVMVWRSERTRFVATTAPTETEWFNRFMTGFKARVGERVKQDAAISIDVMVQLQATLETDWQHAVEIHDAMLQRTIAEHATFYIVTYCASLRGFEGPKIDLGHTRRQIVRPNQDPSQRPAPHIGLALTGRFKKRDQHIRTILIPVAYETASHLQPGLWIERLITLLDEIGIRSGWLFQDHDGDQYKMSHFEEDFYDRLTRISQTHPPLFTEGINILDDFHLARSFRRGATTRATAAGVPAEDIEFINRWNEGSDTATSTVMRVRYSDTSQLIDAYLRFSLAL